MSLVALSCHSRISCFKSFSPAVWSIKQESSPSPTYCCALLLSWDHRRLLNFSSTHGNKLACSEIFAVRYEKGWRESHAGQCFLWSAARESKSSESWWQMHERMGNNYNNRQKPLASKHVRKWIICALRIAHCGKGLQVSHEEACVRVSRVGSGAQV